MKAIRISIIVLIAILFYGVPPVLLYPEDEKGTVYSFIGLVIFYLYAAVITGQVVDKFNKWFKSKLK